jgi:hypothetical protein
MDGIPQNSDPIAGMAHPIKVWQVRTKHQSVEFVQRIQKEI